jgi:hypothetical protein
MKRIPWEHLREAQREYEIKRDNNAQLSLLTADQIAATLQESVEREQRPHPRSHVSRRGE